MKLYEIAVKRPVTTVMVIMAFVFFGVVSYTRLSVDLLPSVNMPIAVVMTTYQAGPQEVESIVTTPMETAATRVPKVKKISSISSENTSIVIVQFEDGVDMDASLFKLGQYTDMAKSMLPEGVGSPVILSIDPNQIPVIEASIAHENMEGAEFYRYVESNILPNMESIDGVSSVSMVGGDQNQVQITLSQDKLRQYGFALDSIKRQLAADNVTLPGGMTSKGDLNLNVKVDGKFKSLDDIKDIVLVSQANPNTKVKLGDIAEVKMAPNSDSNSFRYNGQDSIALSFSKESTANIISTSKAINKRIETMKAENPGLKINVLSDQSVFIKDSVNNVLQSAIMGMVLAILILFIFLKDFKTSLIVGISMPVSVIATFTFLYMFGITINILSLGGLTFAVGMLVDNSIIVLENIYRHIQMGEDRKTAAINGSKEITMAIFASTLTNIAIFLPIIFVGGMIGDWLSNLAVTVTVAMIMSFITAVMVIPMFASLLINEKDKTAILDQGSGQKLYRKGLDIALNKRVLSVIVAIVVSIASVGIGLTSGMELMPAMGSNLYTIDIKLQNGLKPEKVQQEIVNLENRLKELDYVDEYFVTVGAGLMGMDSGDSSNVSFTVTAAKKSGMKSEEIKDDLERVAKETVPSKEITTSNASGMFMGEMGGGGVSFQLRGNDMAELSGLADEVKQKLANEGFVKKVSHTYEEGLPYMSVDLDKQKAATYGLTTYQVADAMSAAQKGTIATRYSIDGTEVNVLLKTNTNSENSIEELKNMSIPTPTGQSVPLSSIATLKERVSPANINKENKIKTVDFTVDIQNLSSGEAQKKIESILNEMQLPSGYDFNFSGATEEMTDAVAQMGYAILIGVVLIYMILAAQFESYKQPLIIMLSIPFSFTGGFLLLGILRFPISVPVLMGMLMLVGIIVNNAILIVDTFNQFRKEQGMDIVTAIREGCIIRLRPMLLTTLTTVLGLVPMAIGFGEGNKMMQPMAIFVAGGLVVGTLLTMVLVPVFYFITDKERKTEKAKMLLENK